jgi:hypothetical protein
MSIDHMYKSMKIGEHTRKNRPINTGEAKMNITYENRSGADCIQFSPDSPMPDGGPADIGFKGADAMHVGQGYEDILFNGTYSASVNTSDKKNPFSTKNGSPPSDYHSEDLLYFHEGLNTHIGMREAVRLGLVRKGPNGYEEVQKK